MIEIIYALAAVVIFLWAFLTGAMFVNIKHLEKQLYKYEKRENAVQAAIDRKLKGKEDDYFD
tara:strand:- start:5803 stop:5988 length:186 start_codon:yes stop_codon:yes gene_type:complete